MMNHMATFEENSIDEYLDQIDEISFDETVNLKIRTINRKAAAMKRPWTALSAQWVCSLAAHTLRPPAK